jgi:hypothetical protein
MCFGPKAPSAPALPPELPPPPKIGDTTVSDARKRERMRAGRGGRKANISAGDFASGEEAITKPTLLGG